MQRHPYISTLLQNMFGQFNDYCFFYIDDLLVHDASEIGYLEHVKIFQKIREVCLKIKLSECAFCQKTLVIFRTLDFMWGHISIEKKV